MATKNAKSFKDVLGEIVQAEIKNIDLATEGMTEAEYEKLKKSKTMLANILNEDFSPMFASAKDKHFAAYVLLRSYGYDPTYITKRRVKLAKKTAEALMNALETGVDIRILYLLLYIKGYSNGCIREMAYDMSCHVDIFGILPDKDGFRRYKESDIYNSLALYLRGVANSHNQNKDSMARKYVMNVIVNSKYMSLLFEFCDEWEARYDRMTIECRKLVNEVLIRSPKELIDELLHLVFDHEYIKYEESKKEHVEAGGRGEEFIFTPSYDMKAIMLSVARLNNDCSTIEKVKERISQYS